MTDREIIDTLTSELNDAKETIAFLVGVRRMQANFIEKLSKRNNRLAKQLGMHPTAIPERMVYLGLPLRMARTTDEQHRHFLLELDPRHV